MNRFLRRRDVLQMTGLSATTIYNLEKGGNFPQHFLITPRCAAWDATAVAEWMRQRQARPATPLPAPDHTLRTRLPGRGKRLAEAGA